MYEELPDLDLNAKADVSMPRGQIYMYQPVLVSGIRGKRGGEIDYNYRLRYRQ